MLTSEYAGRTRALCGRLSGEYSPVFGQTRFDPRHCRTGGSGVAGCFLGELHARSQPKLGVGVGEVGLHGAR
jgi:hypothetical protein